jgi:hypothetical protein
MQLPLMVKLEILQQSISKPKHPAMHHRELVLRPALLHRGGLDDIPALLMYIQLYQPVILLLGIGDQVQLVLVQAVHITDVSQPWVQQAHVLGRHGGLDAAAAVVSANDDVLDFEVPHRVVDHGHDVEVDIVDKVGDVAVDEHLAGLEAGDGFGGDARVGAACVLCYCASLEAAALGVRLRRVGVKGEIKLTNPEILRGLARRQIGEELGLLRLHLVGPLLVVLKDAVVALLEVLAHLLLLLGIFGRHSELRFPGERKRAGSCNRQSRRRK